MRLVNAIPAVVEAAPGLLTALDLPPVSGRGLVADPPSEARPATAGTGGRTVGSGA